MMSPAPSRQPSWQGADLKYTLLHPLCQQGCVIYKASDIVGGARDPARMSYFQGVGSKDLVTKDEIVLENCGGQRGPLG